MPPVQIGGGGRRSGLGRAGAGVCTSTLPPVPGSAPWARAPAGHVEPLPLPALLGPYSLRLRFLAQPIASLVPQICAFPGTPCFSPLINPVSPKPGSAAPPSFSASGRPVSAARALRLAVPRGCPVPPQLPARRVEERHGALWDGRGRWSCATGSRNCSKADPDPHRRGSRLQQLHQDCCLALGNCSLCSRGNGALTDCFMLGWMSSVLHVSYKITFFPCTADVSGVGWAIYSSTAGGSSYLASPLVAFHLPFCGSLLMLLKILSMVS